MSETLETLEASDAFKIQRLRLWSIVLEIAHQKIHQAQQLRIAMSYAYDVDVDTAEIERIKELANVKTDGELSLEFYLQRCLEAFQAEYAPFVGNIMVTVRQSSKENPGTFDIEEKGIFDGIDWEHTVGTVLLYQDEMGETQGVTLGEDSVVSVAPRALQG